MSVHNLQKSLSEFTFLFFESVTPCINNYISCRFYMFYKILKLTQVNWDGATFNILYLSSGNKWPSLTTVVNASIKLPVYPHHTNRTFLLFIISSLLGSLLLLLSIIINIFLFLVFCSISLVFSVSSFLPSSILLSALLSLPSSCFSFSFSATASFSSSSMFNIVTFNKFSTGFVKERVTWASCKSKRLDVKVHPSFM